MLAALASPRCRHSRSRWPCGTVSSLLHVDATREVDDGPLTHPALTWLSRRTDRSPACDGSRAADLPTDAHAAVDKRSGVDHRLVVRGESCVGERVAGVAAIGRALVPRRGRPRCGRRTAVEPRHACGRRRRDRGRARRATGARSVTATSGCPAPARALAASWSPPPASAACSSVACKRCSTSEP